MFIFEGVFTDFEFGFFLGQLLDSLGRLGEELAKKSTNTMSGHNFPCQLCVHTFLATCVHSFPCCFFPCHLCVRIFLAMYVSILILATYVSILLCCWSL